MSTKISNSTITIGNGNVINSGDNVQIHNSNIEVFDWDTLKMELFEVMHRLPNDAHELHTVRTAYEYTVTKDQLGFIDFIKKHRDYFTSSIFCNVASVFLVDFIKMII